MTRKRGRPQLEPGTPTSQITLKLPATLHDRACVRAMELEIDVAELIRRAVERAVAPEIKEPRNTSIVRPGRY